MKNIKNLILGLILSISLVGCLEETPATPSVRDTQADKAQEAANSLEFNTNAEIDNIKARLKLTSQPGLLGYILLFNPGTGNPAVYATVKGKITSGGKRLGRPEMRVNCDKGQYNGDCFVTAPNDEGTFGNSGDYIYFWTESGQYIQWNGNYMYSNQPIRIPPNSALVNLVNSSNHSK